MYFSSVLKMTLILVFICVSAANPGVHHAPFTRVLPGLSASDLQRAFPPAPESSSGTASAPGAGATQPLHPPAAPAPTHGEPLTGASLLPCLNAFPVHYSALFGGGVGIPSGQTILSWIVYSNFT